MLKLQAFYTVSELIFNESDDDEIDIDCDNSDNDIEIDSDYYLSGDTCYLDDNPTHSTVSHGPSGMQSEECKGNIPGKV